MHTNDSDYTTFGDLGGSVCERTEAIVSALSGAPLQTCLGNNIQNGVWEKWAFIMMAAGITCLIRGNVGDIAIAGTCNYANAPLNEYCGGERSGIDANFVALKQSQPSFCADT